MKSGTHSHKSPANHSDEKRELWKRVEVVDKWFEEGVRTESAMQLQSTLLGGSRVMQQGILGQLHVLVCWTPPNGNICWVHTPKCPPPL